MLAVEAGDGQQIIALDSARFVGVVNPKDYQDDYRECVRSVVEKKAHGENVVHETSDEAADEEAKPARSATNLMAALEASLAHAKSQSAPRKRRKS